MGKVIIETPDKDILKLKTSFTSKEIAKIIKKLEKVEKEEKLTTYIAMEEKDENLGKA